MLSPVLVTATLSRLSFFLVTSSSLTSASTVTLQMKQWSVTGNIQTSVYGRNFSAFTSLRFAEPPERFQPPVPWKGTNDSSIDGTNGKLGCPQSHLLFGSLSEDCLYLDVYTPKTENTSTDLLPVMFWVYGGSFTSGAAVLYGPGRLLDRDVVLVTINYRVGLFGFFCTHTEAAPGNMGLMDVYVALQWTREYVQFFGGDPEQITIFGESAGAVMVSALQVTNLTRGMFQGVIAQSGSLLQEWAYTLDPIPASRKVAAGCGCSQEALADLVACMKIIKPRNLVKCLDDYIAEERRRGSLGFDATSLVIQEYGQMKLIYDHPFVMVTKGDYAPVPSIYGSNKNEGAYVLAGAYEDLLLPNNWTDDTEFFKYGMLPTVVSMFKIEDPTFSIVDSFRSKYLKDADMGNFTSMTPGLIDLLGSLFIKSGSYHQARLLSAYSPVWMYSLELVGNASLAVIQYPRNLPFDLGVTHSDDLMYLFTMPVILDDRQLQLSQVMLEMWSNFATYRDPTHPGSRLIPLRWPPLNESESYCILDLPISVGHDYTNTFTITVDSSATKLVIISTDDPTNDHIYVITTSVLAGVVVIMLIAGVFMFHRLRKTGSLLI